MATMIPPTKGSEYIFYVDLVSQADIKKFQVNPTLAAGDVLVSTDGGATSNLNTLPVVTPAGGTSVKVTVSAAEMNGDNIKITFRDVAGDEWCDLGVNIQTSGQSLDAMDIVADAIKTVTDALPDGGALTTIQADLDNPDQYKADLTTLETYCDILDDAINGLAAIKAEVEGLGGEAMRGTDGAALAASWTAALATALGNYTAARAGYLDELAAVNIPADIDTLLLRLSAVRAGYLDELSAANLPADVDTLLARLSAVRAGYLDELDFDLQGALATVQADLDLPDQYKADVAALALEATLTAIKGAGWTDETLKDIKELVDELESGEKPLSKARFKI